MEIVRISYDVDYRITVPKDSRMNICRDDKVKNGFYWTSHHAGMDVFNKHTEAEIIRLCFGKASSVDEVAERLLDFSIPKGAEAVKIKLICYWDREEGKGDRLYATVERFLEVGKTE